MIKANKLEKVLWSIALPGLGQILNKQIIKGLLFFLSEFIINMNSSLNEAIISSFHGDTRLAIRQVNYQWLMFYPCMYTFSIYDAYINADDSKVILSFLPFVFSAYIGTIGVVFSPTLNIFGFLLGPVWLPLICLAVGIICGVICRLIIIRYFNPE